MYHSLGKRPKKQQGRDKQAGNGAGRHGYQDRRADAGGTAAQQFRPAGAGAGGKSQGCQSPAGGFGTRRQRGRTLIIWR